jgi:hypothetical protein
MKRGRPILYRRGEDENLEARNSKVEGKAKAISNYSPQAIPQRNGSSRARVKSAFPLPEITSETVHAPGWS